MPVLFLRGLGGSNRAQQFSTAEMVKLWTDAPKAGDQQFEQMNQEFTAAVERAFRSGGESFFAASRTYDVRPRSRILAAGVSISNAPG